MYKHLAIERQLNCVKVILRIERVKDRNTGKADFRWYFALQVELQGTLQYLS